MNLSLAIPNQATLWAAASGGRTVFDFSMGVLPPKVTFARASPALAFPTAGTAVSVAVNTPRFGVSAKAPFAAALVVEDASTNLLFYARPTSAEWYTSAVTITDIVGTTFGYFNGITVTSTGSDWGRASRTISLSSGITYHISLYLKVGSSDRVRALFRNNSASSESRIQGAFGFLSTVDAAGAITGVQETVLADGVTRLVEFSYTPNFTGSATFGVGPDSKVSGETVHFIAGQIEVAPASSSFIDTAAASETRAADVLGISGLNGLYDVTAIFADGSQSTYADQAVTDGYWPAGLTGFVSRLVFKKNV